MLPPGILRFAEYIRCGVCSHSAARHTIATAQHVAYCSTLTSSALALEVRSYLDSKIVPVLTRCTSHLRKQRPPWPIRTASACGAPPRASGPIPRPLTVAEGLGHPQCAAAQWAALLVSRCCARADSTIRPHACVRWRSPACARRHCNHTCRTSAYARTRVPVRACVLRCAAGGMPCTDGLWLSCAVRSHRCAKRRRATRSSGCRTGAAGATYNAPYNARPQHAAQHACTAAVRGTLLSACLPGVCHLRRS